jgi:transposase InsO family protein
VQGARLLCDVSLGTARLVVPVVFRQAVFDAIHGIAHPGIRASKRLISARFVWKGMGAEVSALCRQCQQCDRSKVTSSVHTPVQTIEVPVKRFSHVHIDIVGPLPATSGGFSHLFTAIDRSTHWAEAIPLRGTSTADCVEALFHGWISRFGVPSILTSDRGVQFTSDVWQSMCFKLGIQHKPTTAYHPQANGMVERFHRQLKASLRARLEGPDWLAQLPWVLLGLRAAPKEDCALSSAEMVYGTPLTLPGEFLDSQEPPAASFLQNLRQRMSAFQPPPVRSPPRLDGEVSAPGPLQEAMFVYVRKRGVNKPLSPLYEGPYRVVQRFPKYFNLDIGGQVEAVSADRLKPYLGSPDVTPALPARRGRPPQVERTFFEAESAGGRGQPP